MKFLSTLLLLAMIVVGCANGTVTGFGETPPPEPVAKPKPAPGAPAVIEATDPSVKSKPAPADCGPGG